MSKKLDDSKIKKVDKDKKTDKEKKEKTKEPKESKEDKKEEPKTEKKPLPELSDSDIEANSNNNIINNTNKCCNSIPPPAIHQIIIILYRLYVREVFDLFDFWDGSDGLVDAAKLGDVLRCVGLNPTNKQILDNGGTKNFGQKQYAFEDILPVYKALLSEAGIETFADFMEAFKTFDREGQGYIAIAELRNVLTNLGERLTDGEVDLILKHTETEEDLDGNVKYEDFIKKVIAAPPRRGF